LVENFDRAFVQEEDDLRWSVCSLVKRPLRRMANRSKIKLREYACTVVAAAVCEDGRWVVIHLGDGGVVGLFGEHLRIISQPKKGEHVNETFFITDDDAVDNLSIVRGNERHEEGAISALALFTDGVEGSLINRHTKQVAQAIRQMFTWLHCQPESEVGAALGRNLGEVFRVRSGDDCTLVLAVKTQEPPCQVIQPSPKTDDPLNGAVSNGGRGGQQECTTSTSPTKVT